MPLDREDELVIQEARDRLANVVTTALPAQQDQLGNPVRRVRPENPATKVGQEMRASREGRATAASLASPALLVSPASPGPRVQSERLVARALGVRGDLPELPEALEQMVNRVSGAHRVILARQDLPAFLGLRVNQELEVR